MQMHLAQQDLTVHFRSGQAINPIERGHIAFRTDNIDAFKAHLDKAVEWLARADELESMNAR